MSSQPSKSASVPKLGISSASARSVDVAKRLHDTETKKALLAMRLQRELRMKPHEAVAVAKSLLAQPAVSRMDLESINLRSLLSDHAEAVKPSKAESVSLGASQSAPVLPSSPGKTTVPAAAPAASKPSPEKPVRKKKAADGMWAEITRLNTELAAIEEEEQKEKHVKQREAFSHTLESQVAEQRRLKAEADAKEAAFAAEQARQLRAWKEQERKAAEALAAKRSRIAADIRESLEEKKAREEAERQRKLADDRAAVDRARREEEAAQAAALRAKMTEKERQEQSKRDNEARQKFKAEELARQKAQDVAMAEELVRIQNEKEAARVADMNARAAKIQAKMARMAEVQKEVDGRAAADAARAQAELERRNREKDEELRHREADRKAREAEAKLIIDAQLKQKAADKLRRKQEELDLARRQKEAAAIAEARDAEAARKAAEHRAQVQAEQLRQMAERNARLRSGDASDVELKLNQSVLKKMEDLKTSSPVMKKKLASSQSAALRARERAALMMADTAASGGPAIDDHPMISRMDERSRRFS